MLFSFFLFLDSSIFFLFFVYQCIFCSCIFFSFFSISAFIYSCYFFLFFFMYQFTYLFISVLFFFFCISLFISPSHFCSFSILCQFIYLFISFFLPSSYFPLSDFTHCPLFCSSLSLLPTFLPLFYSTLSYSTLLSYASLHPFLPLINLSHLLSLSHLCPLSLSTLSHFPFPCFVSLAGSGEGGQKGRRRGGFMRG